MNNINKKIIDLINKNKNMREISQILNISEKQLYIRIKQIINYGYVMEPSYSYNSDIYYNFKRESEIDTRNRVSLKMSKDNNLFRCIVISDLHIGSSDSDIRLLNIVYEYAIKNGINVILNCGDTIEGDYTSESKIIKDIYSQLDYLISKHPYDRSINNYMIFGNHDHHSLYFDGLDISKTIHGSRYDIIPVGFGQGYIDIKKDSIILFHQIYKDFKPIIKSEKVLLSGHGHLMKTKLRDIFWLGVPTLSYKSNDKTKDVIPGFIDLNINLSNDRFEYFEAKHMIINPKVVQVSETRGSVKTLFKERGK